MSSAGEKPMPTPGMDIKNGPVSVADVDEGKSINLGQVLVDDTFLPLRDVEPYDGRRILTVRAVVTGGLLGSLIACSNLYLGLKTGFGADATLFSSIFGFGILKFLERSKLPLVSGYFGPHENNIVQATALGCIGVGFIFISGVPALIQMGLLGSGVSTSYGVLVCLTFLSGFWGLSFAVPLRSLFILKLARPLNLTFPLGTASAITIKTLHSKSEGAQAATRRSLVSISIAFGMSLVWTVASSYAPGILYTWNVFWWIYKWGGHGIIGAVSWGWLTWSWSPAQLGMGMLVGPNPALSFVLGSVLAWGIIGPILVHLGVASGLPMSAEYPGLVTYNAFNPAKFTDDPSPRYWILRPAVFMMLAVSLTTIVLEAKSFGKLAWYGIMTLRQKLSNNQQQTTTDQGESTLFDPVPEQYRIRWWEWLGLGTISFVIAMTVLPLQFDIGADMSLLHLALGFFWAIVVIQVFGAVGSSPISSVSKGSQFITGSIMRDQVDKLGADVAARSNIIGATVSSGAAQQSAELVQDFRTGFLLGTPTRPQWYAQLMGTMISTLVMPGLFLLFTKAFPCILDPAATYCQFATPSVTTWRIVTVGILSPVMPISTSSWVASIIAVVLGVGATVLKRWLSLHPTRKHWDIWVPNMAVVALAMTIPGSNSSITFALGSAAAMLWARYGKESHATYLYSVAAGAIAGEGVGYVILSILQIGEVAGPTHFGTNLGCVAEIC
ncbi:oligopeptide transporter [Colletotrichum tofieldiae]|nr:oligopeptide transporter [Colletotrichum tofieldiae]GKT71807.1 oligopeptide transporter [Colletotrichum tofieldiae]